MNIQNGLLTLVTPDFGISDIWHQYLPFKFVLSQALKQGQIPIWTRLIGGGQPILAQGQMGAFNLLNLLLFGLLPFTLAVTLFYFTNIILACLGGYLLGKSLKFKKPIALFMGLTFGWSGFLIAHASHWDILQAACLLPYTFYFLFKAYDKNNYKHWLMLSFIISQQIFTGAIQIVFINIIGLASFIIILLVLKKIKFTFLAKFILSLFFSLGLSAIQLLPSYQYVNSSIRSGGLSYKEVTRFPYPISHVITFFDPFILGSPKTGTYGGAGIFWENTAYIGKLALAFAIIGFFLKLKKRRKIIKHLALGLLALSLLLSFGNDSPLYFIYTFFPFNLFRVPSRFLLLTYFSLILLAGLTLESTILRFKKIGLFFVILVMIINFGDITLNFYNYHSLDNFKKWLQPPNIVKQLDKLGENKFFTMPSSEWNNIFIKNGWENKTEDYYYLRNNLDPNFNILFDLKALREHNSIPLKRNYFLDQLSYYQINLPKSDEDLTLPTSISNLLKLSGVKYLISANKIKSPAVINPPQIITNQKNQTKFYTYEVINPAPFVKVSYNNYTANNLIDFNRILGKEGFEPEDSVIFEKDIGSLDRPLKNAEIKVIKNTNTKIVLKVKTAGRGVLVIADNYYPEWQAFLNNKPTQINPVNLNQKGIILPKGEHEIKIIYQAKYLKIGFVISVICILFLLKKVGLSLKTLSKINITNT